MRRIPTRTRAALVATVLAIATGASAMEAAEEFYLRYCGACHGPKGRGDGIAAPIMTPRPPDLTSIAARSGGKFSMAAVIRKIDGSETLPAHGARDMPVWGERFAAEASDPASRHAEVQGKLLLIAEYLRSIQR